MTTNSGTSSSLVHLDIGGKKFCTTLGTLTEREPDSMLAAMFSGRHTVCPDPESGCVFIDRDNEHFRHILNWLRDGVFPALESSKYLELLREADFYQLTGLRDGIQALLDDVHDDKSLGAELNRIDIIKCIQSNGSIRFRGVNLSGLDLSKLDLSYIDFSHACLKSVCFTNCDMSGAKFNYADLEGAIFDNATLGSSEFFGANLRHASFVGANIYSGKLIGACLSHCSFYKANLNSIDLHDVDLTDASFEAATLYMANLKNVEVSNSNFKDADLVGADLEYGAVVHLKRQGAKLDRRHFF